MTQSLRPLRVVGLLMLAAAAVLVGRAADGAPGGLRITNGPRLVTQNVVAGDLLQFSASAVFPGEEWIAFEWKWGDDTQTRTPQVNESAATSTPTHAFTTPGRYKVVCTAYHGFKGGVFGVGQFKFRMSKKLVVNVAPSLPMTIGVLTIAGDEIKSLKKDNTLFRISGNVRFNGLISLGNDVIVDTKKQTVTITGTLTLPGAGPYASGLAFFSNVTIDATTGGFLSVDLPDVQAQFEVQGFAAKMENVKIVGAGLVVDFEIRIPRLTEDPSDPEEPPAANAPIDLSKEFPPQPTPNQLAALSFKQFRIDAVAPYLHPLGETKATISNVPFGIAGTKFAIDTLEAGIDPSQNRYFGTLKLKLPTDRGIGGTFEMREGQLERIGFTVDGKVPFWTFTGGLDAIYLKTLSATVVNLAVLEGQQPRTPMLEAGKFDPVSGNVSEGGVVFEWGPSTNVLGSSVLTPIKLTGACVFDPNWNIAAAGQLSFFEDVFGERMRILGAQGSYAAPQDGRAGGTWTFRGDLVFDSLFQLQGVFVTSFDPNDFYARTSASGFTALPPDHWISDYVPGLTGTVTWTWRVTPDTRNRITFHGHAVIPDTFPVLKKILENKGVGFSYNFETDKYDWQIIDVFTVTGPGKAETRTGVIAGGAGAGGLVVTLRHETGAGMFNLRLPNGTLLTPADDNDATVDYVAGATQSTYFLDTAADGTYTAEFDDAGLGEFDVQFFTPRVLPEVSVDGLGADVSIGRYEPLDVPFSTVGIDAGTPIRVYLDDDDEPGGGVLAAMGTAADSPLTIDAAQAPTGTYRVVVQALGDDGMPVESAAAGAVTVRDYVSLTVTRGTLKDGAKVGKDKMVAVGTLNFDGVAPERLFDPDTESLRLTLGGDDAPFVLAIPAGDAGWKVNKKGVLRWKSVRGATPVVVISVNPVKGKFKVKLAKAQFTAPVVNPIHCDLIFGNDAASDTVDWTETSPGKFVR